VKKKEGGCHVCVFVEKEESIVHFVEKKRGLRRRPLQRQGGRDTQRKSDRKSGRLSGGFVVKRLRRGVH